MCNECNNYVILGGPLEKLKEIEEKIKGDGLFSFVKPVPKDCKDELKRQNDNWGSKWDLVEGVIIDSKFPSAEGGTYSIFYTSAWGPHDNGWGDVAIKFGVNVYLEYDEPGVGFSGIVYWDEEGKVVKNEHFDDGYYGEGEKCEICGAVYDGRNEDDWYHMGDHGGKWVCCWCGEKVEEIKKDEFKYKFGQKI